MKSLKVIQLGDVHFPDHRDSLIGDLKDDTVPATLVKAVAPNRLELVMRKIAEIADDASVCGLLICGDLTTKGDLDAYGLCVEYLHKAVEVGNSAKWHGDSLHVVPGNHDVKRELCDPKGVDLSGKFDPLVTSWDKCGRTAILPIDDIRSTVIRPNGHSLALFSMNSCLGSGELRRVPNKLCGQILDALKPHFKSDPPADALANLGEQLDTPAFVDDHVRSLVSAIAALGDASLPIVLAHHNALSQAVPRLEIYTELLNGGLFRAQLASCARPIIYCHGHIHADPIEQLTDHRYPASKILFVSAPEVVDGFNVIEIEFARNDLPVGCKIHQYRMTLHGSFDNDASVSVSLASPDMVARFDDDKFRALLKVCDSDLRRFEELRTRLKGELGTLPHKDTVRDLIAEAEWLGLVQVHNRPLPYRHWMVRRVEP